MIQLVKSLCAYGVISTKDNSLVLVVNRQLDMLFGIGKATLVSTLKCEVTLENVHFQTAWTCWASCDLERGKKIKKKRKPRPLTV